MDDVMDRAREAAETSADRLINHAALAIAVIATFLAICGVKADNMDYGILQQQNLAVDMWNMYQARSTKQYMHKLQRDTLRAVAFTAGRTASAAVRREMSARLAHYDREIARYDQEKAEAMASAKAHEAKVAAMDVTANQLDYTEVLLSLAISLLAVTILTRKPWLLLMSLVPAALGVVMGIAALAELPLSIPLPSFLT